MIIAVDGPSGAGKSTLGKMLAEKLDLLYIDTGAMYRAVGLAVTESKTKFTDEKSVANIARSSKIELIGKPANLRIFLNGRDVSAEIRTNEIGQAASIVSTISEVRKILVEHQRTLGKNAPHGCVLDGRDIGTVVFPKADFKFFLTASPEARAERRFLEDSEKGIASTYEETLSEIIKRDERDTSREDSPLMIAEDAFLIDTSTLNLDETIVEMMKIIENPAPESSEI